MMRAQSATRPRRICNADDGMEQFADTGDCGNFRETAAQDERGVDDHDEHDGSAEDVRLEGKIFVAEAGADEDLKKDDEGVEGDDGMDGGRAAVNVLREALHVPAAGADGDADEDGEHDLGGAGVHDREPVVEKFENREAAENALEDHAAKRGEAEILHPGTFVVAPEEEGKNNDEKAEAGGDEAVGMLECDAADHRRIQSAVGERPVGDGESGVFGSDEGAGGEENRRIENDE